MATESTTGVHVRSLSEVDLGDIVRIAEATRGAYQPDLWEDRVAYYLRRDPEGSVVAEADGHVIGFAHCVLHRGTWSIGDFCYLEDLFVAPEARGRGVARALIEAVYARADELKCERVYWLTHETNPARKLYDQVARNLGFIQYRR